MPIVRFNGKIVYFSHIPKCGGTSVENFLKILTGTDISFLDRGFYKNGDRRWSNSSPQHITGNDISKLFPLSFFDDFFTISRHPLERFCSAFTFQKFITKKINQSVDINEFIAKLDDFGALTIGNFDNHFIPQIHFIYPGATYKLFKLENGLDHVKYYIGFLMGVDVKDMFMPHSLNQSGRFKYEIETLTDQSKEILEKIYKLDYLNFKY